MSTIDVVSLLSKEGVSVYAVEIIEADATFSYTVELSDEYYTELTDGIIRPEELVKKAFSFLLTKESPAAILREFDMKRIEQYFPSFPEYIRKDFVH